MKKLLLFLSIVAFVCLGPVLRSEAQTKYPYGFRTASTLTSAIAVSITPAATSTVYTLNADTNITINAVTTSAVLGDEVILKIKANTRERFFTFGTALDALSDSIQIGKTTVYRFQYTGSAYSLTGKAAQD